MMTNQLIVEGRDYAAALLKHSIDPIRALRLIADPDQRQALQSYIDSLVPSPLPDTKPAKLDKVATQVVRCREAAKGRTGTARRSGTSSASNNWAAKAIRHITKLILAAPQ